MRNFFTSIDIVNEQYIATVFDSASNQEIFKSKPSKSQSKVMQEVNTFLTNNKTPGNSSQKTTTPQQYNFKNSVTPKPSTGSTVPRRCCGRR